MNRHLTSILLALPLVAFTGCNGDDGGSSGGGTATSTGTGSTAGSGTASTSTTGTGTGTASGSSSSSSSSSTTAGSDTGTSGATAGSDTGTSGASSGGATTASTGNTGTTGGLMCDPGMTDCQGCVAMHCCAELSACLEDTDCACFIECDGPPQQCAAMCGILNPGQNEAIAGFTECVNASCDMVCN